MARETTEAQETRTERIGIAVTPSEKRAVRAVAALYETDESNLCRDKSISDIVAAYRKFQGKAKPGKPSKAAA